MAEHPKLELKREWWDLSVNGGEEEFVKDLAAIANTPGGDGMIVIGIDERNGAVHGATLSDIHLGEADLRGKARAKVDPPVRFDLVEEQLEGRTVVVILLPPSHDRPHIVRQHKGRPNCIFIRDGTGVVLANRHHLDEMYEGRMGKGGAAVHVTAEPLLAGYFSLGPDPTPTPAIKVVSILVAPASPLVVLNAEIDVCGPEGEPLGTFSLVKGGPQRPPYLVDAGKSCQVTMFFSVTKADLDRLARTPRKHLRYKLSVRGAEGELLLTEGSAELRV